MAAEAAEARRQAAEKHAENIKWLFEKEGLGELLFNSNLPVVQKIARLSPFHHESVVDHVGHRIVRTLEGWVYYPSRLREIMHTTKSILSGSAVTHSIQGGGDRWLPNDLDLYTPMGKAGAMVEYLTSVEMYEVIEPARPDDTDDKTSGTEDSEGALVAEAGYHVHGPICWKYLQDGEPKDDEHCRIKIPAAAARYAGMGIHSVTHLRRIIGGAGLPTVTRFIEVVESAFSDATAPIGQFISTFAMSWMTSNAIVVAYPKMTFLGEGVMNGESTGEQAKRQGRWREKYESRGYHAVDGTEELSGPCGEACPGIVRVAGDVACLVMRGRAAAMGDEEMPLGGVQWHVQGWRAGTDTRGGCRNTRCPNFGCHPCSLGRL